MWKNEKFEPSPTRNYVAICYNIEYTGHFFRKFFLPLDYANTCSQAIYYFTNVLGFRGEVECCIPLEHYLDFRDQDELYHQHQIDLEQLFPKKTTKPPKKGLNK